ncbi:hypothetical protein C8R45DRAFT_1077341 [Mycena sanguinolenta]|nr:hypothetical protein C8R45DRAFT_1077341 [Mycena sanguinolenta]
MMMGPTRRDEEGKGERQTPSVHRASWVRRRRLDTGGRRLPPVSPAKPAPKNEPKIRRGRAALPSPRRRRRTLAWDVERTPAPHRRAFSVPGNAQHLVLGISRPQSRRDSAVELPRYQQSRHAQHGAPRPHNAHSTGNGEETALGTLHTPHPRIAMRAVARPRIRTPHGPRAPPPHTTMRSYSSSWRAHPAATTPALTLAHPARRLLPALAPVASVYDSQSAVLGSFATKRERRARLVAPRRAAPRLSSSLPAKKASASPRKSSEPKEIIERNKRREGEDAQIRGGVTVLKLAVEAVARGGGRVSCEAVSFSPRTRTEGKRKGKGKQAFLSAHAPGIATNASERGRGRGRRRAPRPARAETNSGGNTSRLPSQDKPPPTSAKACRSSSVRADIIREDEVSEDAVAEGGDEADVCVARQCWIGWAPCAASALVRRVGDEEHGRREGRTNTPGLPGGRGAGGKYLVADVVREDVVLLRRRTSTASRAGVWALLGIVRITLTPLPIKKEREDKQAGNAPRI